MLDVGDGNSIHWRVKGNPAGRPAVVLHGGPGGGSSESSAQVFDLDDYRGGLDLSSPPDTAWHLGQVWSTAELTIVEDEGHGGPVMFGVLRSAMAKFAA